MVLRGWIQASRLSWSGGGHGCQRSFLVLSLGSGISTESRMSTTSPRITSSKSAATTAVELRICALRVTTTPVLLLLASVLHAPNSQTGKSAAAANNEALFTFSSLVR